MYKRLGNEERESIIRGLAQKRSIREIARGISRSPSAVAREFKRISGKTGYRAFSASRHAKTAVASGIKGRNKITKQEALGRISL